MNFMTSSSCQIKAFDNGTNLIFERRYNMHIIHSFLYIKINTFCLYIKFDCRKNYIYEAVTVPTCRNTFKSVTLLTFIAILYFKMSIWITIMSLTKIQWNNFPPLRTPAIKFSTNWDWNCVNYFIFIFKP